ncbi:MAG TPA: DUF4325 domain-containing protein [Solirubrobacteraceae bacterium]|nr:DUF4325 domain-containing protein [Solirubrobacteraceae bacterium]
MTAQHIRPVVYRRPMTEDPRVEEAPEMALLLRMRDFGTTFGTRERGAELREALLARASGEPILVIDFDEVTNVSYSFADEFVGKLAAEPGDRFELDLRNMRESVERTVETARQRRTGALAC